MIRGLVLVIAFLVGAAVMTVELLGPRLLAPHLGTGLLTWSCVIATFLGGIALGNAFGGRLADSSRRHVLALTLALAAATVALSPLLDQLARTTLGGLPHLLRVPIVTALVFLPAAIALGLPGPILGKAVLGMSGGAGASLGAIAAAGALGSVGGTFVTGFVLIPSFGTRSTIWACAAILAALAALGARIRPAPREVTAGAGDPITDRRWSRLAMVAGFALLATEIAAGRVAAIHLGTSIYTWTAVIGVVLVGLSVGNIVGGRLADRHPPAQLLGLLFLIASAAVATCLWTPNLMARVAEGGGPWLIRVALAVAVGFLLPSLALGALSPVIARAALQDPAHDGRIVGRIYAAGTLGAVLAAVLTPYVLVPLLSLPVVFIAVALALAIGAASLRTRLELSWIVSLVLLALLVRLPVDALRTIGNNVGLREDLPGTYVDDSRYFHIVVAPYEDADDERDLRYMSIDRLVHGFVDLEDPFYLQYEYERLYAAIVDRLWPDDVSRSVRCCFIGGGTYTYQRRLLAQRGAKLSLRTIEIDPAVTHAAREVMGLTADSRHRIEHGDARTVIAEDADATNYDFVFGDAFHDVGVPWHLTTRECTALVHERLRGSGPAGTYLVNVVDIFDSGRFVGAFLRTLETTFANVAIVSMGARDDAGRETFILIASDRTLDVTNLTDDAGAPIPTTVYGPADLDLLRSRAGVDVLTDDHAPVEALLAPVIEARRMQSQSGR